MQLFTNKHYQVNDLCDNYGNYIVPNNCKGGIAVDIGCNNGRFIERYKDFFKEIHAYDANYFLIQKLKEEFDYENIFLNNYAVSDTDDKILKLIKHKHNTDNGSFAINKSSLNDDWDSHTVICEVKSISFNTIISNLNTIDYLKIDCETSEYEFLMNKDLSKVKYIGMELHVQLGKERYTELYNFISNTHEPNHVCTWQHHHHQELLFTNRHLLKL
jgi:FkbM family methyltransferase